MSIFESNCIFTKKKKNDHSHTTISQLFTLSPEAIKKRTNVLHFLAHVAATSKALICHRKVPKIKKVHRFDARDAFAQSL